MQIVIYTLAALGLAMCGMECSAQTVSGQVTGHDYVDLGLPSGTKWATYNVGATKPTEYGDYFAWGETKPKEDYSRGTYKWTTDGGNGTVGNKKVLVAENDATAANWGSAWRMPTRAEQDELREGCTWVWVEDYKNSGVNGRLGSSKANGNTIFLPAAGFRSGSVLYGAGDRGYFWSSSLYVSNFACYLYFDDGGIGWNGDYRTFGQSVRSVTR